MLFAELQAFKGSVSTAKGTVNVTATRDSLNLTIFLSDLPSLSSGGIHIHEGTSCHSAKAVGPHFFAASKTSDPWAGSEWISNERGFATNVITVNTSKTLEEVLGHAVVVHSPTNEKVACGLLRVYGTEDGPPPTEEEDDIESSVVGALTVFGLALGFCCCCRMYESCKRIYRKRQGRDTTGFSQLPVVQTGVDSGDLEMTTGKKKRFKNVHDLEDSSDGFSDISDSDSDINL